MGICFNKDEKDLKGDRVDPRPLRSSRAIVIFVVGGPGVGKNTLGQKLALKFNFVLVSISAILREEIARDTEKGRLYKSFMEKGDLLPAVMVVQLLVRKMLDYPDANGYLIIGFPRDKKQVMIAGRRILLCEFRETREQKKFSFIQFSCDIFVL